jgi:two-component system response regulator AtoC
VKRARILVVDDEKLLRWSWAQRLEREGYETVQCETGGEGIARVENEEIDLILLDQKLPDLDGLEVLRRIRPKEIDLPVIMITAHSTLENAVEAMKLGASDFLAKPIDLDVLVMAARRTLEARDLAREVHRMHDDEKERYGFGNIVGRSAAMREVFDLMVRVAESDPATVLLQGQSGTGKDLVARAIHYKSRRAERPLVTVTCTAIPEPLLESELMGHEKGAFTDARAQKKGLLELADGGTVFLDEVGDLPPVLQAKLLRFLEDKTFRRVGGTRDIAVDVRIIAATNRDLATAVREGRFRDDFFYRLNVIMIPLPPLRERREDVPLLADHFIEKMNRDFRKDVARISEDAMRALVAYSWPGNVRELRNVLERAIILGSDRTIDLDDLPRDILSPAPSPAGAVLTLPAQGLDLTALEKDLVIQALRATGGNQSAAGRLLGLNRDQIHYRIEKFGIDLETPA